MENEKDYTEIDLVEVFHVIKDNTRNIFVVTLCCVLIAAVYVFTQSKTPSYTSEALVRFKPMPSLVQTTQLPAAAKSNPNVAADSYNPVVPVYYDKLSIEQLLLTYAELLKSSAILSPVNEAIGATGAVKATQVKGTAMMKIAFSTADAEKAQKGNELLLKKLQEYVSKKEHSETRYIVSEGADRQKAGESPVVEAVVTEKLVVEVIDPPTIPTAPTSNKKRTLAVSALLGILLGSGYAVMHYLMNRKITTRQDIEDYLGLPVIAVVPEESSLTEALARQTDKSVLQKIGGVLWKEQN